MDNAFFVFEIQTGLFLSIETIDLNLGGERGLLKMNFNSLILSGEGNDDEKST